MIYDIQTFFSKQRHPLEKKSLANLFASLLFSILFRFIRTITDANTSRCLLVLNL